MKNLTVPQVLDSNAFAYEVDKQRKELNTNITKFRREHGRVKSNGIIQLINDDQFTTQFIVNEFALILLKESKLSTSKREVVRAIGNNAYIKALESLNKADETKKLQPERKDK